MGTDIARRAGMVLGKACLGLASLAAVFIVGCSGKTMEDTSGTAGADLSSSQCPAKIEVKLDAPQVQSDDQILQKLKSPSQNMTDAEAADTMKEIQPHLKLARADKAVTLSGTLMQACAYKTTRTPAGDNAYSMHFAKTAAGAFSLRIEQLMSEAQGEDQLFINVPINSVSPTSLDVGSSTTGFISAENTSTGHDGSDGFSFFIGTVKVTAKIAN
jgi:hypothetical protein